MRCSCKPELEGVGDGVRASRDGMEIRWGGGHMCERCDGLHRGTTAAAFISYTQSTVPAYGVAIIARLYP